MLRERAGIIDISNFAKYECKGPGAEVWLNAIFANTMPREVGRSCLTPLIGKRGGIAGDFTVTRTGDESFWIIGSGMAERYHKRFFKEVPLPEKLGLIRQTTDEQPADLAEAVAGILGYGRVTKSFRTEIAKLASLLGQEEEHPEDLDKG